LESTGGSVLARAEASLKGAKDQTVTLSKNEHPFIKWDSCILYSLAEITTVETLQGYLSCGSAKMQQSVRADILKLIVDGFIASDFHKEPGPRVCEGI